MGFPKIYIEITNVCNLRCSFCRGTVRKREFMDPEVFRAYATEAKQFTDYVYLHVMGEPFLHPQLDRIIDIASEIGLRVCLTTNGTLFHKRMDILRPRTDALYKISISLHAHEGNGEDAMGASLEEYVRGVAESARELGRSGVISVLRLWNADNPDAILPAKNTQNGRTLAILREIFDGEWTVNRRGHRIGEGVYLEWGETFDWPTDDGTLPDRGPRAHCFAMKDHVAILVDGRVLPCCIDCDGRMVLGDLHEKSLADILADAPAEEFRRQLAEGRLTHPLCRHCNFK